MKNTKKKLIKLLTSTKASVNNVKKTHNQLFAKLFFNKKMIITDDGVGRH